MSNSVKLSTVLQIQFHGKDLDNPKVRMPQNLFDLTQSEFIRVMYLYDLADLIEVGRIAVLLKHHNIVNDLHNL